jgi:hypothetical protein
MQIRTIDIANVIARDIASVINSPAIGASASIRIAQFSSLRFQWVSAQAVGTYFPRDRLSTTVAAKLAGKDTITTRLMAVLKLSTVVSWPNAHRIDALLIAVMR